MRPFAIGIFAVAVLLAAMALAGCGRIGFAITTDGRPLDAALPFCASRQPVPTLCSDFDDGLGTQAWQGPELTAGTLAIDPTTGLSPPASVQISLGALATTNDNAIVDLYQGFGFATHVTTSFAVRVDVDGGGAVVLATISLDDGTQTHAIEFVYTAPPSPAYIEDVIEPHTGSMTYSFYNLNVTPFPPGAWHDVSLDVATGSASQLTVTIDGATALVMTPVIAIAGQATIRIGAPYLHGPSAPWQLHEDNVVVDVQ